MATNSFNYNQLNVVGRDRESIEFWQKSFRTHLQELKEKVDINGKEFKNVVNVANEVWTGEDKEQFIKNLTASANEFSSSISTLISNIDKYFQQDLASFESLQKATQSMTSKVNTEQ